MQVQLLKLCAFVVWKCVVSLYLGESHIDLAVQTRKVPCMPWFENCIVFHSWTHLFLFSFLNHVAFLLVTRKSIEWEGSNRKKKLMDFLLFVKEFVSWNLGRQHGTSQ